MGIVPIEFYTCVLKRIILCFIYLLMSVEISFPQSVPYNCELDGKQFYSDCIKYVGSCQENRANGCGELYFNNGVKIKGIFINNKLQNQYLNYYFPDGKIVIGPNTELALRGTCVSISDEFVSTVYYQNGRYLGSSMEDDQLSNVDYSGNYCDADGHANGKLIPNTSYFLDISSKEYNAKGDLKFWITMVDLSQNKVIKQYGSFANPISVNRSLTFTGFSPNNSFALFTIVDTKTKALKFIKCSLISGGYVMANTLPIEFSKQVKFSEKVNNQSYKDLTTTFKLYNFSIYDQPDYSKKDDKYILLGDSSYIKIFHDSYYISASPFQKWGSRSSLVKFNKNHQIVNSLDFHSANIRDFAVDQLSNRLAVSYASSDSIYLSYYGIDNFDFISNVLSKRLGPGYGGFPGRVEFSKNGSFLFYEIGGGAAVYLNNNLHYGVVGNVQELFSQSRLGLFDDNENIVLLYNGNSSVTAYNIEKKAIIWSHKVSGNIKFYSIADKIYLLSGSHSKKISAINISNLSNHSNDFVANRNQQPTTSSNNSRSEEAKIRSIEYQNKKITQPISSSGFNSNGQTYKKPQSQPTIQRNSNTSNIKYLYDNSLKIEFYKVGRFELYFCFRSGGIFAFTDLWDFSSASALTSKIGGGWHMPSIEEFFELQRNSNFNNYISASSGIGAPFWTSSISDNNSQVFFDIRRGRVDFNSLHEFDKTGVERSGARLLLIKTR